MQISFSGVSGGWLRITLHYWCMVLDLGVCMSVHRHHEVLSTNTAIVFTNAFVRGNYNIVGVAGGV